MTFEIDGEQYVATRNTKDQTKIIFCGEQKSLTEMRAKLLELCFGISESPKNMTWNTLFSRFARRFRSCYATFDSYVPRESDYSKILNNCYLLGIDIDLIVSKRDLREKQLATSAIEKALKKDPVFKQYYFGKGDAELDVADLEYRISELDQEISAFKVSNNYHELEKEADEKSYQKKTLENQRVLINNYITINEQI